MNIVLLERVEKLGNIGDVVKVRDGYARNFLLPQGKALRATPENISGFEAERAHRLEMNRSRRERAESHANVIEGVNVTLIRQAADNMQLYGSVKARDIADELIKMGYEIERRNVILESPIKTLGLHKVTARLHPEVSVTVIANVARNEDEALARLEEEAGSEADSLGESTEATVDGDADSHQSESED